MSRGIIFYNYGVGAVDRLAVAIYTLRRHYAGPITILSDGRESDNICSLFAADRRFNVDVVYQLFNVKLGRNHHYLSKCILHEHTPYDISIYVDSDTIITGDLTPLFDLAEANEFVVTQFSNWRTDTGGHITRRIKEWKEVKPRDIKPAIEFGPAVNTGVMAFKRTSTFMADWFKVARKGRDLYIPDETSCQLILHRYPHRVAEWWYNASCKYDDCSDPKIRVIHYHGRKHCREGLPHNAQLWVDQYHLAVRSGIADIQKWTPKDRRLASHLKSVDPWAGECG